MTPRRFLLALVLSTLVSAVCLVLYNNTVPGSDPEQRKTSEWVLARAITEGKNVAPSTVIVEQELRWDTVVLLDKAPDIAVAGSSHGLLVSSAKIPAPGLQNFSISGAVLSEHLVTAELLRKRDLVPKVWLVFLDPWMFDRGVDFEMWKSRGEALQRFEDMLCSREKPTLKPVFSPKFTPPSKRSLLRRYSLQPLADSIDDIYGRLPFNLHLVEDPAQASYLVLRSDGSYQLGGEGGHENALPAKEQALRQFATNIDRYRYGNYETIDPDLWEIFWRWQRFSREQGSEVWILIPPYHPAIYPQIVDNPKNKLREIERRAREEAARIGAKVFGSYDPTVSKLGEDMFSDGDHLNETGITRLLEPVAAEWLRAEQSEAR